MAGEENKRRVDAVDVIGRLLEALDPAVSVDVNAWSGLLADSLECIRSLCRERELLKFKADVCDRYREYIAVNGRAGREYRERIGSAMLRLDNYERKHGTKNQTPE